MATPVHQLVKSPMRNALHLLTGVVVIASEHVDAPADDEERLGKGHDDGQDVARARGGRADSP